MNIRYHAHGRVYATLEALAAEIRAGRVSSALMEDDHGYVEIYSWGGSYAGRTWLSRCDATLAPLIGEYVGEGYAGTGRAGI